MKMRENLDYRMNYMNKTFHERLPKNNIRKNVKKTKSSSDLGVNTYT